MIPKTQKSNQDLKSALQCVTCSQPTDMERSTTLGRICLQLPHRLHHRYVPFCGCSGIVQANSRCCWQVQKAARATLSCSAARTLLTAVYHLFPHNNLDIPFQAESRKLAPGYIAPHVIGKIINPTPSDQIISIYHELKKSLWYCYLELVFIIIWYGIISQWFYIF